jgi:hypothetical protein
MRDHHMSLLLVESHCGPAPGDLESYKYEPSGYPIDPHTHYPTLSNTQITMSSNYKSMSHRQLQE